MLAPKRDCQLFLSSSQKSGAASGLLGALVAPLLGISSGSPFPVQARLVRRDVIAVVAGAAGAILVELAPLMVPRRAVHGP